MTLEQALLALNDAGRLGPGDPDCFCDDCELDRKITELLESL